MAKSTSPDGLEKAMFSAQPKRIPKGAKIHPAMAQAKAIHGRMFSRKSKKP